MKYDIGDTVMDSWGYGASREAKIIDVRKSLFVNRYFVRHTRHGTESPYPRSSRDLELVERQADEQKRKYPFVTELRSQEPFEEGDLYEIQRRQIENKRRNVEKMRAMRNEERRGSWYDVIAQKKTHYMSGRSGVVLTVEEGDMLRMRAVSDGTYELETAGEHVRLNNNDGYEVYNINDYATEWPRRKTKEDDAMGGELYGYPPEEEDEGYAVTLRKLEIAAKKEQEQAARIAELEKKNEVARREEVAETYGIVTERHLWSVVIDVPMSWSGLRPTRGNEQKSEVLTESRDMCEAAMAAEAMAKGIHEEAYVLSIDYVRVIGAIKK